MCRYVKPFHYAKRMAGGIKMSEIKNKMIEIIQSQPEDASYEEIMRELAFERMVRRGLADSRHDRVISNEEMERQIQSWRS
jgi:ribosomal protein S3AE